MSANRRHPSKEEVRAWMDRRRDCSRAGLPLPLPSPDEIRRELGWHQAPAVTVATPMLVLPMVLAELAALTAMTWYWMVLQGPRDRRRTV